MYLVATMLDNADLEIMIKMDKHEGQRGWS